MEDKHIGQHRSRYHGGKKDLNIGSKEAIMVVQDIILFNGFLKN